MRRILRERIERWLLGVCVCVCMRFYLFIPLFFVNGHHLKLTWPGQPSSLIYTLQLIYNFAH